MTLIELLQLKIDRLNADYEEEQKKISNSEQIAFFVEKKADMDRIIRELDEEMSSLRNMDLENIISLIEPSLTEEEIETYRSKLHIISIVLKGKYDNGLNLDLNQSQRDFYEKFIDILKKETDQLERQIVNMEELKEIRLKELDDFEIKIISFEDLLDKIKAKDNNGILTTDDFALFYQIILDSNFSSEQKKEALINFKLYNENQLKKKPVSVEEIKECFKEFDVNDDVYEYIDNNAKDLTKVADVDSIRKVLSYLSNEKEKENGIELIKRFPAYSLVIVAIYGNIEIIKKNVDTIKNNNNFYETIYETPSAFIKEDNRKRKVQRSNQRKGMDSNRYSSDSLRLANEISFQEMLDNEAFLSDRGMRVSISDKRNIKVIKTSHYRVVSNYNILKNYGVLNPNNVENFPASTLSFSRLADRCDNLIELGLLHGPSVYSGEYSNYAVRSPSIIGRLREEQVILLYYLRNENFDEKYITEGDYYKTFFSKVQKGNLSSAFNKNLNYSKDEIKTIKENNFVDLAKSEDIPNYEQYEKIISTASPIDFDSSILETDEIAGLEKYCRLENNKYVYQIGDVTISRLKVLRCYSALKKQDNNLDKDALLYCIIKGSYINPDRFEMIKKAVSYISNKGENNELFKKL